MVLVKVKGFLGNGMQYSVNYKSHIRLLRSDIDIGRKTFKC